jgi:transposase
MVNYREILRFQNLGYNITEISAAICSSRKTVRDVLGRAKCAGLTWPLDDAMINETLYELLYPERLMKATAYKEPDCEWIHRELAKKGVNLSLLWTEYQQKCRQGNEIPYMYTQFCEIYRDWARKNKATMRIHHKPGDAMEVDWAGDTLQIIDPATGETTDAYLFVAVLPCSCFAYTELCRDMKSENWLMCHVHAYEYFNGVSRLLIPDNLRTGITKNTRLETIINRSYSELADHYNTAVVPTRVKAPQDKSHAEGSVRYASTWILAALRNETFFSFTDAKEAVAQKLEELNDYPFKKRGGNRREAYLNEEKEFLQPLPKNPYEPAVWTKATVLLDYVVSDGLNKYSVPYDLIGEVVDIRTTRDTVEVFLHGKRVASHPKHKKRERDPITIPEHMPEKHRKYLAYNKEEFLKWGESVGPKTEKVIHYFLENGKAPEQGYKSCVTLMHMGEKYGNKRIEETCREILTYAGSPSIRSISLLIKEPLNRREGGQSAETPHRSRGITRGVDQFRKGGEQA